MFFIVSKVGWYLVQPLVVLLLGQVLGIVLLLLRFPKSGLGLMTATTALFAVICLSPLGLVMMSLLENRFPKPTLPERVSGIVVLGGSFDTIIARTRDEPELNDAADRVTGAVALARRYPEARLIFSGGAANILAEDITESAVAQRFFKEMGLPPERLEIEDQSRNTIENARFSRRIADPQLGETWLLVTSAYHMPRSVGCFRAEGFDVLAYPVDYSTPTGAEIYRPSTATIRNAEKVHFAIREYLGLLAYRVSGRIDRWLPGPSS